ncbi:cytochrome c oxidase assembly protein COX16 homolog, mitochondrial-like [Branchiostoma lanceolatum]|uniref:cytochrome c oxidase assembly protein COX16 homolog, mitochondrial-like n=1 Tax=Branchiostoma lanceolatum TaxID=7740 RepID=UPI003454F41E
MSQYKMVTSQASELLSQLTARWKTLSSGTRAFLKVGLPMIIMVVGGSYGLERFSSLRYDVQFRKRRIDKDLEEKFGWKKKEEPVTLENQFETVKKEVDVSDWENIRGPRPWEDSKEFQMKMAELRQKRKQQAETSGQ